MTRSLIFLVVLAVATACRTMSTRERFGGLWSSELERAARYLPAGFDSCRITTATVLEDTEDNAEWNVRWPLLTATRSARGTYEYVAISCHEETDGLPLDHPDRILRRIGLAVERVGQAGGVDMFHVDGSNGQLFDYQAEVDGFRLSANGMEILRDALQGLGSLEAVLRCCTFPPLGPGAELLQVVRVDDHGVRAFATFAERERPEEVRVFIDADDLTAARHHLLTRWNDHVSRHARETEDGVVVAVPRRTPPNHLLWMSYVQDLSGIAFFDDL